LNREKFIQKSNKKIISSFFLIIPNFFVAIKIKTLFYR
jgi:hypothetical protein